MARRGKIRTSSAIVAASAALLSGGGLLALGSGVAAAAGTVSPLTLYPAGAAPATIGQGATSTTPDLTFSAAGLSPGDVIHVDLAPNGATSNPTDASRQVHFGGTVATPTLPSVYEAPAPAGQTGPRFAVSAATNPLDPQGSIEFDQLNLTVMTPATDGSTYTLYVGTIASLAGQNVTPVGYSVVPPAPPALLGDQAIQVTAGINAATGPVATTASYAPPGVAPTALTVPSIATVGTGNIVANTPSVAVPASPTPGNPGGATNFPISNVTITETAPGQIGAGATVPHPTTVTLNIVNPLGGVVKFSAYSHPTVSVSPGTGAGIGSASIVNGAIVFQVFAPSSLAPATYTFSGLALDVAQGVAPTAVSAQLYNTPYVAPPGPPVPVPLYGSFVIAGITTPPLPIAGADADGTAVAVLDQRFNHQNGANCVTNGAVVLARDNGFQDALSASYLAGNLNTGILLTPSGALSAETANELKLQGVSTVYIVGGPQAISPAVISAIQSLPVYACGGASTVSQNTNVATVVVAGDNADATSAAVAEYPKSLPTNYINLSAAYAHESTYNDSGGANSSVAPSTAENTAIIASDQSAQDAISASALAYRDGIPVILTNPAYLSNEAQGALTALGIQQVIEVVGPRPGRTRDGSVDYLAAIAALAAAIVAGVMASDPPKGSTAVAPSAPALFK